MLLFSFLLHLKDCINFSRNLMLTTESHSLSIFSNFSEVEELIFPRGVKHFLQTASKLFSILALTNCPFSNCMSHISNWLYLRENKAADISPKKRTKNNLFAEEHIFVKVWYELWSLLLFRISIQNCQIRIRRQLLASWYISSSKRSRRKKILLLISSKILKQRQIKNSFFLRRLPY